MERYPNRDAELHRIERLRNSFQEGRVMMLGVELGLFEQLSLGPATAAALAHALALEPRGTEITLDALVALDFLTKDAEGCYANMPAADAFLVRTAPRSVAHIVAHAAHMLRNWAILHEVVREGFEATAPLRTARGTGHILEDADRNRDFILGMAEVSRGRVAAVVDHLPLAGAQRFVDLGGGPGHYAAEAVRRHPDLAATLVDLPLTINVAREVIAAAGLQSRIETVVCDFYAEETIPLDRPADVIFISQVFHAESPAANLDLLRKVVPHLAPGGAVVVNENIVEGDRTQPTAGALFAMNMLAGTPGGRTYTEREIAGWLSAAGLVPEPAVHVADRTCLITGRRPR